MDGIEAQSETTTEQPGAPGIEPVDQPLIGRGRELAAIIDARAHDRAGVVIGGEAGSGKTYLLRAATRIAADEGDQVEWIQATASAATVPFAALADLFPARSTQRDPSRLFQEGVDAVLSQTDGVPLTLAIDDAHLLDGASAAFILHLAGKGVFVLATVRTGEIAPDAVVALWKDREARRLQLSALTAEESGMLAEKLLGGPVEQVAVQWAHSVSAGNPLYLRELLSAAVSSGAFTYRHGLWRLDHAPTASPALAELILQRLVGLRKDELSALAVLSLGDPLERSLALELCGPRRLALLESQELAVTEVIQGMRVTRPAHPLYGETAQHRSTETELDRLRIRLAEAVSRRPEQSPGDALRIATWLVAADADVDLETLIDAAREAYAARDPELAERFAVRAEQADAGFAATLVRGRALAALGRPEEAEAALSTVEGQIDDPQDAGGYLFDRINTLIWGLRRPQAATELIDRAGQWWDDRDWQLRLDGMRLMALSAGGRLREAVELADRLAGDSAASSKLGAVLATSGAVAYLHTGHTEKARAVTAQDDPQSGTDHLLDDLGLAALISWALTRLESGVEWDEVEHRLESTESSALRHGDRIAAGPTAGLLGHLALSRGRPRTAIRHLNEALGHLELHDPRGLAVLISAQLAVCFALTGDLRAAELADAQAREMLASRQASWHESVQLTRSAAWVRAVRGDGGGAVKDLINWAKSAAWMPVFRAIVLRDALALGGRPAQISDLLSSSADCDAPLFAAVSRWAESLHNEDSGQLMESAMTLSQIGAGLDAAQAAMQAAAISDFAGLPGVSRRAAAFGTRLMENCEGATTPALRAARIAKAELTPRERELAELAAAGHSNAEIAAMLTVSIRTVESHLYHAMSKLGTSSRKRLSESLSEI